MKQAHNNSVRDNCQLKQTEKTIFLENTTIVDYAKRYKRNK